MLGLAWYDVFAVVPSLQVDQPLCVECAGRVREEMEAQTVEIEAECEAYEHALHRLQQENAQPLSEEVRSFSCCA